MAKVLGLFFLVFLAGCGSGDEFNENLDSPSTIGTYLNPIPLLFWTEVETSTSYRIYWRTTDESPTDCLGIEGDYQTLDVTPSYAGIDSADCAVIVADGVNGGFSGPTPEGTCLTFDPSQGPWDCGKWLSWNISSRNADGESR